MEVEAVDEMPGSMPAKLVDAAVKAALAPLLLRSESDVAAVASDLAAAVSRVGLPFLDGLAETRVASEFFRARVRYAMSCVMSHAAGDTAQAELDLARALQEPPRSDIHARLRAWAASNGLVRRLLVV